MGREYPMGLRVRQHGDAVWKSQGWWLPSVPVPASLENIAVQADLISVHGLGHC